ncbi:MAG TPA: DUF4416 family protein [bacterium]|nr:DUF4416 family protein [bacterium]
MGTIRKGYPVKMFCGVIYSREDVFSVVKEILVARFGETDIEAGPFAFDFTDYYREEMGDNLLRRFLSFKMLVQPDQCHEWKYFTNQVEEKYFVPSTCRRRVNIDPGYMNLSRVILLSTKDYFHRIYLQSGIFAESTLYYRNDDYSFFPWTYPDYQSQEYLDFFRSMRVVYKKQE